MESGYLNNGKIKTGIIEFLKRADTGIVEAQLEKQEAAVTDKSIIENIRTALEEGREIKNSSVNDTLRFGHQSLDSNSIFLKLADESRGTLQLLTHLYPLTDIRTRHTDNFEAGYLQGYFGGIPFLGDLDVLFASPEGAK